MRNKNTIDVGLTAWFRDDVSRWKNLSPVVRKTLAKYDPNRPRKPSRTAIWITRRTILLAAAVLKRSQKAPKPSRTRSPTLRFQKQIIGPVLAGKSQYVVAKKLGVSRQYINRVMKRSKRETTTMEKERRILAFRDLRHKMDGLFAEVDKAQRAVDKLARRDKIDLSPEAILKRTEGFWLQEDTAAALKHLNAMRKEAIEFHDRVYIKERDEMTALGFLKPRPGKGRH